MRISQIQTKRLILKKPSLEDAEALLLELDNWPVAKWLARLPEPYTLTEAEGWIETISHMELNFNLFLRGALIGGVGLVATDEGDHELGFWLGENYWKKGYAIEAIQALLAHASKNLPGNKVVASCLEGNDASLKILKGLGFEIYGSGEIFCQPQAKTLPCSHLMLIL